MLAAKSVSAPRTRVPLQPKNIIHILTPKPIKKHPPKSPNKNINDITTPTIQCVADHNGQSNKENTRVLTNPLELLDASLAEELNAVRQKLERLRLDKEKTEKILEERDKLLGLKMIELVERGEFQKELEIEVDRLYRLKQLKLSCLSPIRSLREKEMEKKSKEGVSESAKSEESKEGLVTEISTTESSTSSFTFETKSSASTCESTTAASATTSTWNSTATSKMRVLPPRLSLGSASTSSSKFDHDKVDLNPTL